MAIYLLINGFNGGSTDSRHLGWFEINSVQLGAGIGVAFGAASAPSFSEVTVSLTGVAPDLLAALAARTRISSIRIEEVTAAGNVVYDLLLGEVLVTGDSFSAGGGTPSSSLSFNYERIGLTTPTSSFGYDILNDLAIAPADIPSPTVSGSDSLESGTVTQYFLLINGLNGGSTDAGHAGWFEISSLQLGAGVGVSNGTLSAPSFSELVVSLTGVSPALLAELATGAGLGSIQVHGVNTAGNVVYDLRLGEVFLTGDSFSTGGGTPSSSLSFNYARIGLTTPTSSFGYDIPNDLAIDPATIPSPVLGATDSLESGFVTQYFLLINGLNGGSTDAGHAGWFEISSLQLGAGVGVTNGTPSLPSFSELVVTLTGISPALLAELATGAGLGSIQVHGVNTATGNVVYDLRLGEVFLTGDAFSTGGGTPSSSLSFNYERIGLTTPTSSFGYDIPTDQAIAPATIPLPSLGATDSLETGGVAQYYLLINGLNGGSTDAAHAGWFEISSLQLGAGVGVTNGTPSLPSFSELVVTLTGISPALLAELATGTGLGSIQVHGVNTAGNVVYDLRLGEVLVTGDAFSAGGDTPSSSLSFNYERIGLTTPTSSFGYDIPNDLAIDPATIPSPVLGATDSLESGGVTQYYLLINGLNGGSTDTGHAGWFEISSLQLGAGVGVTNGIPGQPSFSELVVTLTGISSDLLAELATRTSVTSIQVHGVNAATGNVVYDLRLGDVFLTGDSFSSGGDAGLSSLSFHYERIALITPDSSFGYDIPSDSAIAPGAIPLPIIATSPVVTLLTASVGEDGPNFSQDLLNGASDPNPGTTLVVQGLDVTVTTSGGNLLTLGSDYTLTGSTLALTAAGFARFNSLSAGQTDQAVFDYAVSDGRLATPNTLTLRIDGVNDGAFITGTTSGSVTEDGGLTTSGALAVSDPDAGQSRFAAAAVLAGAYGVFTFNDQTGAWGYTLNNGLAAVQALNSGQTLQDTLAVSSLDGTAAQTLTVTILGANEVSAVNAITGTNAADTLNGTAGADLIRGLGGADRINGFGGDDFIFGGAGSDTVNAGDGNDFIYAESGDGNDSYAGGAGNDTLVFETSAAATVNLDSGVSTSSQTGTDSLRSIENVRGGSGNDQITGNDGSNILTGGGGGDTLSGRGGTDSLFGDAGNDSLSGGDGDDLLNGGANDDALNGGAGKDTLVGGTGSDQLTGGSGNDTFVFAEGFGNDRITDFDANPNGGQDLLDLSAFGITAATFASRVVITDIGAATLVAIDAVATITLIGVGNASTVTAQDFLI